MVSDFGCRVFIPFNFLINFWNKLAHSHLNCGLCEELSLVLSSFCFIQGSCVFALGKIVNSVRLFDHFLIWGVTLWFYVMSCCGQHCFNWAALIYEILSLGKVCLVWFSSLSSSSLSWYELVEIDMSSRDLCSGILLVWWDRKHVIVAGTAKKKLGLLW